MITCNDCVRFDIFYKVLCILSVILYICISMWKWKKKIKWNKTIIIIIIKGEVRLWSINGQKIFFYIKRRMDIFFCSTMNIRCKCKDWILVFSWISWWCIMMKKNTIFNFFILYYGCDILFNSHERWIIIMMSL